MTVTSRGVGWEDLPLVSWLERLGSIATVGFGTERPELQLKTGFGTFWAWINPCGHNKFHFGTLVTHRKGHQLASYWGHWPTIKLLYWGHVLPCSALPEVYACVVACISTLTFRAYLATNVLTCILHYGYVITGPGFWKVFSVSHKCNSSMFCNFWYDLLAFIWFSLLWVITQVC